MSNRRSWHARLRAKAAAGGGNGHGRASIEEDAEVESLYFISTLPWLHYSALIQPVAGGEESNPRITWGQYRQDGAGRVSLPVTLLAHHALVDGIHIARFYENLDRELAALCSRERTTD